MTRLLLFSAVLAAVVTSWSSEVSGNGGTAPADYVPALIANGELSLSVDFTGAMVPDAERNWWPSVKDAQVWWQGRRKSPPKADLFGFGGFTTSVKIDGRTFAAPTKWRQTLDTQRAMTVCANEYGDALSVTSELFVPKGTDAVVIRRTFAAHRACAVDFCETYALPPDERRILFPTDGALAGRTFGKRVTDFRISATSSSGVFALATSNAVLQLDFALKDGECRAVDVIYSFCDNRFDAGDVAERARRQAAQLADKGFDGLLAAHKADWAQFWSESEIVTPEPALNRLAESAQYTLRANVGRWSFPVGINRECWSGRYFGFDEMFQCQAMAATGHFTESVRCPDYRARVLRHAQSRIGDYCRPGKWGGWWFWEMDEDGDCENCPPGFWEMHIFNHATVARSAWEHYNYTGDLAYLRTTAWPILLNMSRYFRNNWVYEGEDGLRYIGKCTDLERLGPARDRPFLTTCGAIDTLSLTARAARLLGTNDAEIADFAATAAALRKSFPVKDGAYVVDTEARQGSVAQMGGLYPFPVTSPYDPRQRQAAESILANLRKYGNMYPIGEKVCPWYAGYLSAGLTRLGNAEKAVAVLRDAASMQGALGELWEINEKTFRRNPNFATGAGNCLYALTRLFVDEAEDAAELFRGVPADWKVCSFRLPVPGGSWITASLRDGRLASFSVRTPKGARPPRVRIPERIAGDWDFGPDAEVCRFWKGFVTVTFAPVEPVRRDVAYVAHRGEEGLAPEGSRPAYAYAVRDKMDIMKLDLQLTKDRVVVTSHDPLLKRTMGWDVKIRDVTLDEIRAKRFKPVGGHADETILTLAEALAIAKGLPEIWLDFKYFNGPFAEKVLAEVDQAGIDRSRLMVATFTAPALAYFRDRHPEIRRVGHVWVSDAKEGRCQTSFEPSRTLGGADELFDAILGYAKRMGLYGVNVPYAGPYVTPEFTDRLRAAGLWVSVWFVDDRETADRYRRHADAYVTKDVSVVR